MYGLDLCQNPKNLVFGSFLGLLGPPNPKDFFQKSGLLIFFFLLYDSLTPY